MKKFSDLKQISIIRRGISLSKSVVTHNILIQKSINFVERELYNIRNKKAETEPYFIEKIINHKKTSDYAVILHLYYTKGWETVFVPKLKRLNKELKFDLFITMPKANKEFIITIQDNFPAANILIVPNTGRDVLPFIKTAFLLSNLGYVKALKIHSKKSKHRDNVSNEIESGADWLQKTLNELIPDDNVALEKLLKMIKKPSTGMIGPKSYHYPIKMYLKNNIKLIERILESTEKNYFEGLIADKLDNIGFFAGTMFWVDIDSIKHTFKISASNFPKEKGQTDGTIAHALERVFYLLQLTNKYDVYSSSSKSIETPKNIKFPKWYLDDIACGKPKISIVIPVYADIKTLNKNIKSLICYYANAEDIDVMYINDCGPEYETLEKNILSKIRRLTNFYYIKNKENLGFVNTCNIAAKKYSPSENDILLLNSDTRVTKGFVEYMREALYSQSRIAAVTSRSNNATIWSVPMSGRLANYRMLSYFMHYIMKNSIPKTYITPTVHGFCVLIRKSVINQYGLFDTIYGKGYGEENDFAMRVMRRGWLCAVANRAYVFHFESKSFGNTEREKQISKNEKILVKRYPEYRELVQNYWDTVQEIKL